jgi:uncharacterized protein RhaS with RHS repeats
LLYYVLRYYDANLQRWINRDPIGEKGSVNLYQFVRNSTLATADAYGECPLLLAIPVILEALGITTETAILAGGSVAAAGIGYGGAKGIEHAAGLGGSVNVSPNSMNSVNSVPVIDIAGVPPFVGAPGSTVRGDKQTRKYGDDGYPLIDRDWPHPNEPRPPGNQDHAHDWDRPPGGGPPTHPDRSPSREPKADDPPAPRGPGVPPPCNN